MLVNEFKGLGRITTDKEHMVMRVTTNNTKVIYFTVALNSYYAGEQKTQYVDCVIYGKKAESFFEDYKKMISRNPYFVFDGEYTAYLKENTEINFKYKEVKIKINNYSLLPTKAPQENATTDDMNTDKIDIDFDDAFDKAIEELDRKDKTYQKNDI